jgi:positive phototaxis protein PixI
MLALLPVSQVTEVLKIPAGQITPIPHLPAWVMGVYNWRGDVLWMVDLGHLLGLTPWYQQSVSLSICTAMVLHPAGKTTSGSDRQVMGLAVTQVQDIEWCDPACIQVPPPTAVQSELTPFLRGYWLKPNGEMLSCLDGNVILSAMPKG